MTETEIIIEIDYERRRNGDGLLVGNGCIGFPSISDPRRSTLRSRYVPSREVGSVLPDDLIVPGVWLGLDMESRIGSVVDPLSFPENQDLLGQLKRVASYWFRDGIAAQPELRLQLDDMATEVWRLAMLHLVTTFRDGKGSWRKARGVKNVERLFVVNVGS